MTDTTPTTTPAATPLFHAMTGTEVVSFLRTDAVAGLTEQEAASRLAVDGPNRLEQRRRTPAWRMFLSQFQDFMIYVLLVAVVISAVEGQTLEAIAILAILLLNGVLGYFQEYRAEAALEALQELSAPVATVIRGGVERDIPAERLVAGDVVLLEAGDRIPADGRLLEAAALRTVEGALTGESQPVRKHADVVEGERVPLGDRRDMVFAGTSVAVGRGRAVITGTGLRTEMGRIAEMLENAGEGPTPLEVELEVVGKRIALIVLAVAAAVFAEEIYLAVRSQHGPLVAMLSDPAFRTSVTNGLLVAVSLAVAAIPEGLPAIVTVALSLGVRRMAEHNAIVRRLHAVETLGSTSFICSDKTGTLTLNRMTVRALVVGRDAASITPDWALEPSGAVPDANDLRGVAEIAAGCNDARFTAEGELVGDPTETALITAAEHLAPAHLKPPRIGEVPFDSERKRMTTVHRMGESRVAWVKGGTDVVLALCTTARLRGDSVLMTDELRRELHTLNDALAADGFRTLAFASRTLAPDEPDGGEELETGLEYLGILGLVDPARTEVPDAVAECRRAGIKVAMVTGDHALTARAIASQVGILDGGRVVSGSELDAMTDDELAAAVEDIRVYARVNPEHKLRIVDALKRNGEIVAMTGDGVNDAPALKQADIGVAMGLVGTDVSREAADMVLSDDDFATIVEAVREGRTVFDNLRKVILFLLSCNMSEVLVVAITSFFSPTAALLPLQLLWINLVTDGLPALALGVDPPEADVMDRKPRDTSESILSLRNQAQIAWQGLVMTVAALVLGYVAAPALGAGPEESRTMLFCALVLTQLLHAFDFRSMTGTVFSARSLQNRWLVGGLIGSSALQVALVYLPAANRIFKTVPLGAGDWLAVVAAAVAAIVVIDVTSLILTRQRRPAIH